MTPAEPTLAEIRRALARHTPHSSAHEFRPAAVLVPLLPRPDGLYALFTERSKELRTHAGQVSFPGGSIEDSETPEVAALREAREEVGLDPEHVEILGRLDDCPTFVTGFVITPVVGVVNPLAFTAAGRYPWTPSPAEIAALHELPLREFLVPAHRRTQVLQREGVPYEVTWYTVQGTTVWGATARILRQLLEWTREPLEGA